MNSKVGILMPVASLPCRFGSGDFGPDAYRFVDDIAKAGFSIWQILPLNPLGYGNSPYQPFSSFAMDEMYISLDLLAKEYPIGTIPNRREKAKAINYQDAKAFRAKWLRQAFGMFQETKEYKKYIKEEEWLESYAVFMAFKQANELRPWNEWAPELRDYPQNHKTDLTPYQEEIRYQCFLQYILYKQWNDLKAYANQKGIQIMGDIPFYVGLDSADCWSNRPNFLLTKNGKPRFIAGVPPDYFAATGQRWGNPIYDWNYMEKDGFRFWIERIAYNYTHGMFDIIRVDHFRAFDTYWKIPESCPTAMVGKWVEAPGIALFDKLFREYPDIHIVAEDLGDLRPEVYELRDRYGFAGMNILSFTFNPNTDNHVNPHCLAYTGTHDNETLAGYYKKKPAEEKKAWQKWFKKRGFEGKSVPEKFLAFTVACGAEMIIIPMTDWLLLPIECTMNHPGTVGSPNWEWRLSSFEPFEEKLPWIKKLIRTAK